MAGEINFGLQDPNAFLRGAQTMNTMMGNLARKRAGSKLARGDQPGAVGELYKEGMIDEGQQVEHNATANATSAWGLDEAKRKTNAQMAVDVATALDNVRMQQGDRAVPQAFEQLIPAFRQQGATDEHIQKYREALAHNPQAFIAAMSKHGNDYLQRFGFSNTTEGVVRTDKYEGTAKNVFPVRRFQNVPRGAGIVQLPDAEGGGVPQDDQYVAQGVDENGQPIDAVDPAIDPNGATASGGARVIAQGQPLNNFVDLTPEEVAQRGYRVGTRVQRDTVSGREVVLQAPTDRADKSQFVQLTPEEVRAKGYRDGTKVQRNVETGQESVVQAPAAGTGSTAPGGIPRLPPSEIAYLNKLRTEYRQGRGLLPLYEEFVKINEGTETGGSYGVLPETLMKFDPVLNRMIGISSQATPAMRNGLPGAASDRDVAMFRNATVGVDKPLSVNRQVRDMAKLMSSRQGDFLMFLEAWGRKHGTILGAEEAWGEYAEAERLFEDETGKNGLPKVLKPKPWRQYFPELRVDTPIRPGAGGSPASTPQGGMQNFMYNPETGELE